MEYSDEELKKIKQEYIKAIKKLIVEYSTIGHKIESDFCPLCQLSRKYYKNMFLCKKCPAASFHQKDLYIECFEWLELFKYEKNMQGKTISEWRSLYWKHNLEIIEKLPLEYFQPYYDESFELELPPNSDNYKWEWEKIKK